MTACEKASQKVLISLNSITATIGGASIIGGVAMKIKALQPLKTMPMGTAAGDSTRNFFVTAPYLVIVTGVFIVLVSVSGCIGARQEKIWLLKIYKVVIILLLIGLIVMAGLVFGNQATIKQTMDEMLQNFVNSYVNTAEFMDVIQVEFECCGVHSSRDWEIVSSWNELAEKRALEDNTLLGKHPVPDSCCVHFQTEGCGLDHSYKDEMTPIHLDGCSDVIWVSISTHARAIGLAGITLSIVLLLCLFFSCSVISLLSDSEQVDNSKQ